MKEKKIKVYLDKYKQCTRVEYKGISIPAEIIELYYKIGEGGHCTMTLYGECDIIMEIK
ncbi:MAG: hypothetical protein PHX80_03695 [Candidatus Nanoarchaeia archaeon]|nr:hypothetical protein [Candidatus Nanoarchaeia archaeon]